MKKIRSLIFLSLFAFTLSACNSTAESSTSTSSNEPTTSEQPTETTYKVNYEASTDYSITGLKDSYVEKEKVSFKVVVNNDTKEVQSVKQDTTTLTSSNDTYSFRMPNHDVTLYVTLTDKGPSFNFSQVQYELQDGVDRSEIQGAPWINANLPGQVAKIKKPSLKDDFYTSINYDDLVNNNPGMLDVGSDAVNTIFNDLLLGTSSADNNKMVHRLYTGLTEGSSNAVHNYLTSFNYNTYSTTKEIFNDEHSFFTLEKQNGYYYLYFNDGYYYGATNTAVLNHEATDYPSLATTRDNIVSILNDSFDLGLTESEIDDIYTFDYDMVNTAVYSLSNWNQYQFGTYWLDSALNDFGFTGSETNIYVSSSTTAVLNKWSNYSTDVIKNDLILRLAYQYRYLLGLTTFRSISVQTGKIRWLDSPDYTGYADSTVLWNMIQKMMPLVLEKAYLDVAGDASIRNTVTQTIQQVINGYKATADTYDWLDEATKAGLLRKLNNMNYYSCYSTKIKNYPMIDETNINTISLLEIYDRYQAWYANILGTGQRETNALLTYMPSYTVNAFYASQYNSFVILNGVLGGMPMDGSIEEVLGSVGVVIGHEISHSIDENGSQYDEYGEYNNWWSNECKAAFTQKVTKMKKFYNKITLFDSTKVNGDNVNTEATADMGGVHICLEIAKTIDNFDYDLFFTTYAKLWLHRAYSESGVAAMLEDEHPFPYLRVNATVGQFEEFYETYNIGPDDRMYIPENERVTIW